MKHAYLITANANWNIIRMCLQMLDQNGTDFFLLIDRKIKSPLKELMNIKLSKSQLIELPRMEINWGGYSQIQAEINLLRTAIKGNYDYYHFLQGSDLPIKSKEEINCFFEKNRGTEFIQFTPSQYEFAKWKCCYYHVMVENRFYRNCKLLRGINHAVVAVQRKLNFQRKQPKLFHGSALFSITHDCATYVLQKEAVIKRTFSRTCAADEVFLQTMIMQSQFVDKIFHFESVDGHARYIDWEHRNGNSPKTLTEDDFQLLMELPEQYCFARKITDSNIGLAEKIANELKD